MTQNPEPPSFANCNDLAMPELVFELAQYIGQFKMGVLQHINEELPVGEWGRFRDIACDRKRYIHQSMVANLSALPEALFDESLTEDGISVAEIQEAFKHQTIEYFSDINGQKIGYIQRQGIYFWSTHPNHRLTLMLWLTFPAYPPNW